MYLKMLQGVIKRMTGSAAVVDRSPLVDGLGFTIRFAYPDDHPALRQLAALDSQDVPDGPLLVAEVGGELWAAVTVLGGRCAIADPFHHTAELVALLHERAERLTRHGPRPAMLQPALRVAGL
jgi:hypothetical protein